MARLHHTNIVPVYGAGECEGTQYFAMQFIAGLGLDQVLTELQRQRRSRNNGAHPKEVARNGWDGARRVGGGPGPVAGDWLAGPTH